MSRECPARARRSHVNRINEKRDWESGMFRARQVSRQPPQPSHLNKGNQAAQV
eukprot:SAG11_NODE_1799_length_4244_cov_2.524005_4_plen_53_part_00